jgi:hypothetical protein
VTDPKSSIRTIPHSHLGPTQRIFSAIFGSADSQTTSRKFANHEPKIRKPAMNDEQTGDKDHDKTTTGPRKFDS